LESNFNNDAPPESKPTETPGENVTPEQTSTETTGTPVSAAMERFRSCRWMQPAEDGADFCSHREVKPYAGTTSFDAAAWCPDCAHFKLRRVPKKRQPTDYSY
jgi:hypothetical protein